MKRVLHISDLHFGRIHPPAIESLKSFLLNQTGKFDLIIMTGDWTQRARVKQFKEAAEFISELKIPVVTVPGNHDLPLYNIFARILHPLKNYREFISPLTSDTFVDDELAVVGFRTATFSRTVEGTILKHDIKRARKIFEVANPNALRIIACHHPLIEPNKETDIRPEYRVKQVLELKPHIIMSGHSHLNWIESVGKDGEHKIIHISAGSAVSNRLRGEVNSFHTIEIENKKVKIETYFLEPTGFITREKVATQTLSY